MSRSNFTFEAAKTPNTPCVDLPKKNATSKQEEASSIEKLMSEHFSPASIESLKQTVELYDLVGEYLIQLTENLLEGKAKTKLDQVLTLRKQFLAHELAILNARKPLTEIKEEIRTRIYLLNCLRKLVQLNMFYMDQIFKECLELSQLPGNQYYWVLRLYERYYNTKKRQSPRNSAIIRHLFRRMSKRIRPLDPKISHIFNVNASRLVEPNYSIADLGFYCGTALGITLSVLFAYFYVAPALFMFMCGATTATAIGVVLGIGLACSILMTAMSIALSYLFQKLHSLTILPRKDQKVAEQEGIPPLQAIKPESPSSVDESFSRPLPGLSNRRFSQGFELMTRPPFHQSSRGFLSNFWKKPTVGEAISVPTSSSRKNAAYSFSL